jgi:uncharacterized protein (TIGR00369 family)
MEPEDLPGYRTCFVCGWDNDLGLKLRFRWDGEKAYADYIPRKEHTGFEGVIHGGIVNAVLDEAMFWAVYAAHRRVVVTTEMSVRLKRKVSPGERYLAGGRVTGSPGRVMTAESALHDTQGRVCAQATGRFFPVPGEEGRKMALGFEHSPQDESGNNSYER